MKSLLGHVLTIAGRLSSACFVAVVLVNVSRAQSGPVTWVIPDPQTRTLILRSSVAGVSLSVTDPQTGADLNTPDKLYEYGWVVTPAGFLQSRLDGFYETIPSFTQMGRPLRVEVKNIHPGTHAVAAHYFDQPFDMGSTWASYGLIHLDGQAQPVALTCCTGQLLCGIGGHDQTSLYEQAVGQVGSADQAATKVGFMITKWEWSKQITLGTVRITTVPSIDVAITNLQQPAQQAVRERLQTFGPLQKNGTRAYCAAVLPAAIKIKPKSFTGIEPRWLSAGAKLATARNEKESFQILLYHPDRELKDVKWFVDGLTGSDGKAVPGLAVMIAPVGYIRQLDTPYDLDNYGWVPEPILTFLKTVNVQAGDAQTLWVRVSIPATAQPGVYRGTIRLTVNELPDHLVPFEVEVWDITRPSMPSLPVVVGINPQEQWDYLLDYGVNPSTIYGPSIFAEPESSALPVLQEWAKKGVRAVNLGYLTYRGKATPPPAELKLQVDAIEKAYRLAEKAGLGDVAYCYLFDEAKAADYPAMKTVVDAIRQRLPKLRLITTAYWGEDLDFGTQAGVDINTWVPIVQHFRNSALVDCGRKHGRDVWWYSCNYPQSPMPNILLNSSAMETRMLMGLMPQAFRVGGFLYYATQGSRVRDVRVMTGPYTNVPVEATRGICDDWWYLNGPGGITDPLPSLRMENFRDGLEDYDLITIALSLRKELVAQGKSRDLPGDDLVSKLQNVPNPYVTSVLEYCRDPQQLETLRRTLATYILKGRERLR